MDFLLTVYMPSIFSLHIKAFLSLLKKKKLFSFFNPIACLCKLLHEYQSDYQSVLFIKYLYAYISFFLCKQYYFEWNSHNIPGSASLGL